MDRRYVIRWFAVYALSLLMSGCVPGVAVEWEISTELGVPDSKRNIERLRRLLSTLGYIKNGEVTTSNLVAEFFSFPTAQRFNVTLLPEANGSIRLKLEELLEKQFSPVGRQQITLITKGLEKEFGYNRVMFTRSPVGWIERSDTQHSDQSQAQ